MNHTTCKHCHLLISRTNPHHAWYHNETGQERCDARDLASGSWDYATPRAPTPVATPAETA